MQKTITKVDCNSVSFPHIGRIYKVGEITFNKSIPADKELLEKLFAEGKVLAGKVNRGQANDSTRWRDPKRVLINSTAGLIAEYCWKEFLNAHFKHEVVVRPEVTDTSNQIDLLLVKSQKTIEIRSSFPRNGLNFALCHQNRHFKVIGPYSNFYKANEKLKDFYLMTLFPFDVLKFFDQNILQVYLSGAATAAMMNDGSTYIETNLTPDDEMTNISTNYRVIPFPKSLDIVQLLEQIKLEV